MPQDNFKTQLEKEIKFSTEDGFDFFSAKKFKTNKLKSFSIIIGFILCGLILTMGFKMGTSVKQKEVMSSFYAYGSNEYTNILDLYSNINNKLKPMSDDYLAELDTKIKVKHSKLDTQGLISDMNTFIKTLKLTKSIDNEYFGFLVLSSLMNTIRVANDKGYINDKEYDLIYSKYDELKITKIEDINCPIWDKSCNLKEYKEVFNLYSKSIKFNNSILHLNKQDYKKYIDLAPMERAKVLDEFKSKLPN